MNRILKLALVMGLLMMMSCGGDEVSGCIDPQSKNFDSKAVIDDGSCAYFRDDYIGMYKVVNTGCSPTTGFFDNLTVLIKETRTQGPNDVGFLISGLLTEAGEDVNFASVASGSSLEIDGGDGLKSRLARDAFNWKGKSYIAFWFDLSGTLTFEGDELVGRLKLSGTDVLDDVNQTVVLSYTCDYRLVPQ